jgi:hypothetical protein
MTNRGKLRCFFGNRAWLPAAPSAAAHAIILCEAKAGGCLHRTWDAAVHRCVQKLVLGYLAQPAAPVRGCCVREPGVSVSPRRWREQRSSAWPWLWLATWQPRPLAISTIDNRWTRQCACIPETAIDRARVWEAFAIRSPTPYILMADTLYVRCMSTWLRVRREGLHVARAPAVSVGIGVSP